MLTLPMIVQAEVDEECDLCNIAAGVAVAVCEEFSPCQAFMSLVTMIFLFVALLVCICGGEDSRRDIWDSRPTARQVAGFATGYSVASALFHE